MVRNQSTGIKLPQSILDEINGSEGRGRGRRHKSKLSRKEARKQERDGRKQRKSQYFSTGHAQPVKRVAEEEHGDSPKRKRAKTDSAPPPPPSTLPQPPSKTEKRKSETKDKVKDKKPTALAKLAGESSKKSSKIAPRSRVEADEDNYIAYLESKLGLKQKGKGKSKPEDDDGLDGAYFVACRGCQRLRRLPRLAGFRETAEVEGSTEERDGSEDALDEEEEWGGITSDRSVVPFQQAAPTTADNSAPATRYVPPHLRKAAVVDGQDAEVIAQLTKKLKGLLNRMTEQNLGSIIEGVEETYRHNRRHDVMSTLTTLIIDGTSSHSLLLDSYVVLHAAFVASLHKIVGIEFAAYFVQTLVADYERHRAAVTDPDADAAQEGAGKECSNLIVLISELYNFQVVSCVLIYDIIRSLLAGPLVELDVELLLKVMRNSGHQLRVDDPSALKDIIQIVQEKVEGRAALYSSRTKFMIETLSNLKNNKVKKGQQGQTGGGEAVERMKKFLSGLTKKRHVLAHEPLRVSLDDLHSAESRGKWWLVGAAWGGDPLAERQADAGNASKMDNAETKLLKLARKQGMNTDIRRSIFVVLMSSDDYVDACERLAQLGLTEVQQREIVRVLLHCCGNEVAYNPYYALVGQHLCRQAHSYKITLQFCLWDFLRDLGETRVGGAEVVKNLDVDAEEDEEGGKKVSPARMRNVAKLYAWWIAKDATALTILKPVDFTALKPRGSAFLRDLLVQTFVATQSSSPVLGATPQTRNRGALEEVFIKAARVEALAMGLVYFITQNVVRDADKETAEGKFVKWAAGVAKETLRTGLDVVPGLTDDL
ncbi:hypothetical protein BD626DRAFT_400795 [Schizophyllum amplum]|uniref:MI domain-containing protein n=1 Tax=Schizophyllum amplum TaxID=97359 RepID=A0A550CHJ5_9AGAR|nr:hypothetical protein BD626DRAFT_400795 [Auriculariopsis ampla]